MSKSILNLTFMFEGLIFLALVYFTTKFIFPPIQAAFEKRARQIADGMTAQETLRSSSIKAQEDVRQIIRQARLDAGEIISKAEAHAAEIVEAARNEAINETERQKAAATSQINTARILAQEDLRKSLPTLMVSAAETVLGRKIDQGKVDVLLEDSEHTQS